MDRDFIPFQQALDLQSLKFDTKCIAFYEIPIDKEQEPILKHNKGMTVTNTSPFDSWYIAAPLYQQAFRWIRDNHKLWHSITPYKDEEDGDIVKYGYDIIADDDDINEEHTDEEGFISYEEAELVCLQEMIKLIKSLKDEENSNT